MKLHKKITSIHTIVHAVMYKKFRTQTRTGIANYNVLKKKCFPSQIPISG